MNHIRDYVNSLDESEIMDIIHTYEQCVEHNWTIVEETPHIKHSKLFLQKYDLVTTVSRRMEYSDMIVKECYRNLALRFMYENHDG
jgi:hypothetical protein